MISQIGTNIETEWERTALNLSEGFSAAQFEQRLSATKLAEQTPAETRDAGV